MSLTGIALAIGVIVDNGIIMSENAYQIYQLGRILTNLQKPKTMNKKFYKIFKRNKEQDYNKIRKKHG
jgi:Cu/Ag efflux pump CusA